VDDDLRGQNRGPEHALALFKQLYLASPDAIFVASVDGRISAANPAAEKLFGYSASELVGSPIEVLIPERLRGRHPQHRTAIPLRPALADGYRPRAVWTTQGWAEFPVDIMLSPVRSAVHQAPWQSCATSRNASRWRLSYAAAKSAFACSSKGTDYAIFMLAPDGTIATWNSGAERIKGYRGRNSGTTFLLLLSARSYRSWQAATRVGGSRGGGQIRR